MRHERPAPGLQGAVHSSVEHDSAARHVSGRAEYTDDIPEPRGTLHAYVGLSTIAHGRIVSLDLSGVRAAPGVVDVLTAADIAHNDISPTGRNDEPVLAEGKVMFFGQPVFAVLAYTRLQARKACKLAKIDYEPFPHLIDVQDVPAGDRSHLVTDPLTLQRGEPVPALDAAPRRIKGAMVIGGQDHFYLEGQVSLAIPGENKEMLVWCSTQHPSEVQHMVAHVLGASSNDIEVKVRRMGGGFGGKETQGNQFAVLAALFARKHGRAVKLRLDRDDDMEATGKRHDFHVTYDVGFDGDGRIRALDMVYAARAGFSADLSGPVTDRALFHADNCYFIPDVRLRSEPRRTNTVSNTAFRGFGGPQGMVGGERVIEEIAYALGLDPLEVRKRNFYGKSPRNVTPYHQTVTDNIIARVVDELEQGCDYQSRREAVLAFNACNEILKKGIALTPVKFGISFTATWYNQAGALVHLYQDGSVHLNHGGTEMGQGLHTKVAQVVADEFQINLDDVRITATATGKVPNTSATAASSGTDLNAAAAADAARQIKARLVAFAAVKFGVAKSAITFGPNQVLITGREPIAFRDLVKQAYMARVHLSAAGFYKTPEIHWDRAAGRGRPFFYFAYGAACSEVTIDTLTGEYRVERTDLLHDVGKSLNPAIDIGQVEGAFIQGMGWLTTEELWWDGKGRLRTHAPSTYKIPLASDLPRVFNTRLVEWSANKERAIRRSKAVGEPPFMLAISVFEALSMAVASVASYRVCPRLDAPATPERVLMAVERLRAEAAARLAT
jgi:xanthine dehydrogenase large subunit